MTRKGNKVRPVEVNSYRAFLIEPATIRTTNTCSETVVRGECGAKKRRSDPPQMFGARREHAD
jgi:hypothetical protein